MYMEDKGNLELQMFGLYDRVKCDFKRSEILTLKTTKWSKLEEELDWRFSLKEGDFLNSENAWGIWNITHAHKVIRTTRTEIHTIGYSWLPALPWREDQSPQIEEVETTWNKNTGFSLEISNHDGNAIVREPSLAPNKLNLEEVEFKELFQELIKSFHKPLNYKELEYCWQTHHMRERLLQE